MYRQYSSRNQRNRGIKVKHALQICLLVAICFWLIYQVKHSHDKNKEFEASDAKGSLDRGSIGGLIRIRRKNIRPLYEEIVTEKKQHNEATEEEETAEEDENNHEEDRSQNQKAEEENEASRDGDDETDEHEVEKLDTEVDQEEDNVTDEAREDGIDSETEGEISDNGNGRKQENSVGDGGHDRGDKSNREAREEFYEADDASSAVTRDNHTQTTENEKEVVGISDQHHENILEQENKENHGEEANNGEIKKRLEVDGGEVSDDANPSSPADIVTNITTSETKENNSDSSEKGSSLTEAPTDNNLEASNSTTDVTAENPKLSEQNVTKSVPELDHDQGIVTEGTSTEVSNLKTVKNHFPDSKSTGHTEPKNSESNLDDFSKPSNDTDSFTFVRMTRSEHSLEDGTNTQKNETVSDISDSADS